MPKNKKSIKSNLKKIDQLHDDQIDYSDIPPLDDSFFSKMTVQLPHKKKVITLRLDQDILNFFQQQGKGYQTRMNAVLKAYMLAVLRHFKFKAP